MQEGKSLVLVPDGLSNEPGLRVYALRWPDGRVEQAYGKNPAAAALSLGYGFDDFKDLTWEEQP
ncbi:MAG TPA: hypothetical protein VFK86_15430 [Bauldia sp.]|nr:hypothetical protein [Bauldia sp.]